MKLRIANILYNTRANGPGNRICIWVQGCTLACPGCFNPDTHDSGSGREMEVSELIELLVPYVHNINIEGLTISGGEPLQQWKGIRELLEWVNEHTSWTVIIFTGYTIQEIKYMNKMPDIAAFIDVLISGRYNYKQRIANGLLGSSSKIISIYSGAYSPNDFTDVPVSEIVIENDGSITITGIDPIDLTHAVISEIGQSYGRERAEKSFR